MALRQNLGLPQKYAPSRFWNNENIEAEARKALEEGVEFTNASMVKAGKRPLIRAIKTNYPGGLPALMEKLGITGAQVSPDEADEMMRGLEVLP